MPPWKDKAADWRIRGVADGGFLRFAKPTPEEINVDSGLAGFFGVSPVHGEGAFSLKVASERR